MSGRGKRPRAQSSQSAIFGIAGYRCAMRSLIERALTHSSVRGRAEGDYERLEFLGDRVLGLLVADCLLKRFPAATEGELALRLNALVSREACAEIAKSPVSPS